MLSLANFITSFLFHKHFDCNLNLIEIATEVSQIEY